MGDVVQTEGHALLRAVSQGRLRLARLLLEGGAYVDEGNERGETALSAACTYGDAHVRARMVRYLLEQGAHPNMADSAGRTALMRAVHERAGVHVVSLLLKHGADPSLRDYKGESALTRALGLALQEDHLPTPTAPPQPQGPPHSEARATLQLLLQACESRGQDVLILTCCSEGGHHTIRQYHHTPPDQHHLPLPTPNQHHTPSDQIKLSENGLHPPLSPERLPTSPAISSSDHAPSGVDPAPSSPGPAPLSAASPSDVHVANPNIEGVFSFSVAPRPRGPRVRGLKRLNSEPWGLTVPRASLPPPEAPPQGEEAGLVKPASLAACPQRRHSIETHDSSLGDQLTDRLTLTDGLTLMGETLKENSDVPGEDAAQSFRQGFNVPSLLGTADSLSSPLATRRGRQGAGLLERRGSGTLLMDHLSHPRSGFLPPLFHPQRPIPDIHALYPAPSPAPSTNHALKREVRKKKLLRRHSMQPEQMKLLSVFQQVLSENEEK